MLSDSRPCSLVVDCRQEPRRIQESPFCIFALPHMMETAKLPREIDLADKLPVELLLAIIEALRQACPTSLDFQRNRLALRSVSRAWSELPLSSVVVDEERLGAFDQALEEDAAFAIGIRKLEIAFGNTGDTEPRVAGGLLERAIGRCAGLQELVLLGNSVESSAAICESLGRNEEITLRRLVLDPLRHTYWIPLESLQGSVGRSENPGPISDFGYCRLFSQTTFTTLELHGNSYVRSNSTTRPRRTTSQLKELSVSGSSSILVFTQVLEASDTTLESFSLSGIRRDWRYNQYTMLLELLSAAGKNLRHLRIIDHFCAKSTPPYIERLIPSLPLLTTLTLGTTGYTSEIFPLLSKLTELRSIRLSISIHLTALSTTSSDWPFLHFIIHRPTALRTIELEDPIGQPRIVSRARDLDTATDYLRSRWERICSAAKEGTREVRLIRPESWGGDELGAGEERSEGLGDEDPLSWIGGFDRLEVAASA